jgi:hypothetical protein
MDVKYSSYTPAQKLATQRYRQRNKDKINQQRKQYYKEKKESDPEFIEYKRQKAREYYHKKKEQKKKQLISPITKLPLPEKMPDLIIYTNALEMNELLRQDIERLREIIRENEELKNQPPVYDFDEQTHSMLMKMSKNELAQKLQTLNKKFNDTVRSMQIQYKYVYDVNVSLEEELHEAETRLTDNDEKIESLSISNSNKDHTISELNKQNSELAKLVQKYARKKK